MSKFPNMSQSIFSIMSKMANDHQAVNLSQGFPNFPVDAQLTAILARVSTENHHQYMPSAGYFPLLEKIGQLVQKSYDRTVDPHTEILITAGATQAIFTTIQTFVDTHDEVIVLDPAYDCYDAPIILCYGKPIHIALKDDFSPDWNAISDAMNLKTKMIIINNPHNPSGKIWTAADFIQLENLLSLYPNVLVLSDEVYEFITFENKHIAVHTRKKLVDRSVIISSFGKSFHITGWKIGYAIAPAHLMAEIKKVHQFLVFSVNSVAQVALSEYLDVVEVEKLGTFYQHKRDAFRNQLKSSRLTLLPCEGSYFQIASYAHISNESDIDFTKRLVTEFGVAAIPISVFYANGQDLKRIRFCFAKEDDTLQRATEKLCLL